MNAKSFIEACTHLGLELSSEQVQAFEAFEEELYRANEVMNLTRVPREECWVRHFVDSLLIQDLLPNGSAVVDLGTGPGFPAWPLACARPDLKVTAVDSSGKMLTFLRGRALPNLTVVQSRAEELEAREQFSVVTGRALAPLPIQIEISAAQAVKDGRVIPMRSSNDLDTINGFDASILGLRLSSIEHRPLPTTDVVRVFPVYDKVKSTPRQYPRKWAEIKKKPLPIYHARGGKSEAHARSSDQAQEPS